MSNDNDRLAVEIGENQTRYGRVLGGAARQYMLRVYMRFINESPQLVTIKRLGVALDRAPLDPLLILGPSLPVLLTSKGQEQLRTDKIYSAPFALPPGTVSERYAFFFLPADFDHELSSLSFAATVTFSTHEKVIPFVVKR